METNLDIIQKYFKKAIFDSGNDSYKLNEVLEIEWIGEGEIFVVNETYFDRNVGYVTNPEVYCGAFNDCLNFCIKYEGIE